jgi:hypothetical protein
LGNLRLDPLQELAEIGGQVGGGGSNNNDAALPRRTRAGVRRAASNGSGTRASYQSTALRRESLISSAIGSSKMCSHATATFHKPGPDGPQLGPEKPGRILCAKTQKLHEHEGLALGLSKPRHCSQDSDPIVNWREVLVP